MVPVRARRTFMCTSEVHIVSYDILVNTGFRYEYFDTIEAKSAHDARVKWKARDDWTVESFKVRKVK